MIVFGPITNRINGHTVSVYRHGIGQFEVEIVDALGEYVGGTTADTQSAAINYALNHI